MSTAGAMRCFICRNVSRMALLTRFRATALPTFLDAMIPSLFLFKSFGSEKTVQSFPMRFFFPSARTFSNSGLLVSFSRLLNEKSPIFSGRQAFSSFSPAVGQNTSAANGCTAFAESVYAFSFDVAGLKRSFHESFLLKIRKTRLSPPNQMVSHPSSGKICGMVSWIISPQTHIVNELLDLPTADHALQLALRCYLLRPPPYFNREAVFYLANLQLKA